MHAFGWLGVEIIGVRHGIRRVRLLVPEDIGIGDRLTVRHVSGGRHANSLDQGRRFEAAVVTPDRFKYGCECPCGSDDGQEYGRVVVLACSVPALLVFRIAR